MRLKRERLSNEDKNEKNNHFTNIILNAMAAESMSNFKQQQQFGGTQMTFKTELKDDKNLWGAEYDDESGEISQNVIKSLILKYKKENHHIEENLNFKKIQEIMKNKGQLGDQELEYIKNVTELENQLKNIKSSMESMKRNELARINKEYITNDYERRFKISQETLISALIGEDNTGHEYAKQKREQRKYYQSLQNIRTYNMLEDVSRKKIHGAINSILFESAI
jgi:hypothetical protein